MTEHTLTRARAGDEDAFRQLTDPHRRELQLHCYRILGSLQDSEDLVQETLLAAWRGLASFEERSSMRTWLYRIATNRCLNALRDKQRRPETTLTAAPPEPTRWSEPTWLEPYPDVLLEGIPEKAPGPEARYESKETIELAFIAGLQRLPPYQRAVLVLRDVLGFRAAEVADILDTSEASVKGALQRARTAVRTRVPDGDLGRAPRPDSDGERRLAGRFADAIESGDIEGLVALLSDDAWLTMPPYPYEYQGRAAIAEFLEHRAGLRGAPLRVVPIRANTQAAFGCYRPLPHTATTRAYGLLVLTMDGDRITAVTCFPDSGLFPHFGLPRTL